ncbi:uncharacterized protein LOC127084455 [Lathyrus oleraceus]|uniref:Uncharacterized protein n=1 Tax=Pisum sativum TaxID=3888 RepID=A0A9D4WHF5_PEA|nr:uncharacterized protein LOC127084455 [Pisum sativum]KAI5402221.1 hypothetical protein KIW84_050011 [Pisum sativum]
MDLPNTHLHNPNNLQQSPPNHAANGHLVYVRRKSEGETPKNTAFDNTRQLYCEEEIVQPKHQIKDPKVSCFPAFAPSLGNSVYWEERYQQLHMFLRKLDQSNQADYIQMLHSLSSIQLSRHAVELEKRSIHLSLEEAKELQRVAALNVLGKPVKNFKAPADHGECSDKLKTST